MAHEPTEPAPTATQGPEYLTIEPGREEIDTPCLEWITVEHPEDVYVLGADDYVLDTYFNTEFDAWEALVLLQPDGDDEE